MTDKMKMFCLNYLTTGNAKKSAEEAGYSKKTAYSIGSENLKKPEVIKYIEILKSEIVNDKEKIILENILYWRTVIKSTKAKESDKLKASELIGKYAAMFTDKLDLTGHLKTEEVKPVTLDALESQITEEKTRDEED